MPMLQPMLDALAATREQMESTISMNNTISTTLEGLKSVVTELAGMIKILDARLTQLEQDQHQQQQQLLPPQPNPPTTTTVEPTTAQKASTGAEKATQPPKATFATVVAKYTKPKPSKGPRPIPTARAVRTFVPPSSTSGYQFVYVSQKGRLPMNEIRRSLTSIGINNSRIIDIHFPDRNKCGLLVHNDFVTELTQTLTNHGITTLPFDPNSASVIRDPQHKSSPTTVRQTLAQSIQKTRVLRIIARSPLRVRNALIASFLSNGTITQAEWNNFSQPNHSTSDTSRSHVFFSPEFEDMEEDSHP